MSQADIYALVLTFEGVTAAVARGIPVNARGSWRESALYRTVLCKCPRDAVVAKSRATPPPSSSWLIAVATIKFK
jgi:hypothetical protein